MNVLVVSEPGVDGVFRYVDSLCHFLVSENIGVHFAYSDRRGGDQLKTLVSFVERNGGETLNLSISNRPAWADLRAASSLRKLAHRLKPDVIHSHSPKAGALARALSLAGIGCVQVYQPHAYVGMQPKAGRFDSIFNSLEGFLGRMTYTITCSMGERRFALEKLKIPETRLFGVRHGVDTEQFRPAGALEKLQLRARLGLPEKAKVLGFIGRSSAQNDPRTLYRAFAKAAAFDPDIALFHVGQGELDEPLRALVKTLGIQRRVFRQGNMGMTANFYQAIDGFILTSQDEGFSLTALEALAANLPLILSDTPGNQDMLAQSLSHSWKAQPGNALGFARGISSWSAALDKKAPVNHRETAMAQYQTPKQMAAILGLYRRLVGSRTYEAAAALGGQRLTRETATRPALNRESEVPHRANRRGQTSSMAESGAGG